MTSRSHFAAALIGSSRAASRRPFAHVLVLLVAAGSVLACSDRISTAAPRVSTTSPAQPTAGDLPLDRSAPSLPLARPAPQTGRQPPTDATPEPTPMV